MNITTLIDDKKNIKFSRNLRKEENGEFYFKEFFENGTLKKEGKTKTKFVLHYLGELREYYSTGILQSTAFYDNNQMISNQLYNEDGSKYYENVFSSVDKMPVYSEDEVGLLKYIATNTHYPEKAKKKGISGKVIVEFIVLENGAIDGVRILKSVNPELDEESVRVVKSIEGKWEPAQLDGKSVRFLYNIPIVFWTP